MNHAKVLAHRAEVVEFRRLLASANVFGGGDLWRIVDIEAARFRERSLASTVGAALRYASAGSADGPMAKMTWAQRSNPLPVERQSELKRWSG